MLLDRVVKAYGAQDGARYELGGAVAEEILRRDTAVHATCHERETKLQALKARCKARQNLLTCLL